MPFLSVVTRCYKRPTMLLENVASLEGQTDPDYEQIFIVDEIGYGIAGANRALATAKPAGDYVLVLDDDDVISEPRAIEYLKDATDGKPDVVIFKGDFHDLGILPDAVSWGNRPIKGHIGSCAFITSNAVWKRHIAAFGVDEAGDYEYLKSLWQDHPSVVWLDRVLTMQPVGRRWGEPE